MGRNKKVSITDPSACHFFHANFKTLLEHAGETPNSIRIAKEKIKAREAKWEHTQGEGLNALSPRDPQDDYYKAWPSYSILSHCNSFLKENVGKTPDKKWYPTMEITAKLVKVYNHYILKSNPHKITTEDFLTQTLVPSYDRDVLPISPDRYCHDYYVFYRYGSSSIYSGVLRIQAGRDVDTSASLIFNNHDNGFLYTDEMLRYLDPRATDPDTEAQYRLTFYDGTCVLGRQNLTIQLTGRYDHSKQLMIVLDVSEFNASHYTYYHGGIGLALNANGTKDGCHAFKIALADAARFRRKIWPNVGDDPLKEYLTFRFDPQESIPCPKDDDQKFFRDFLAPRRS